MSRVLSAEIREFGDLVRALVKAARVDAQAEARFIETGAGFPEMDRAVADLIAAEGAVIDAYLKAGQP